MAGPVSRATTGWRLLRHPAGSGPWNMGVDEALLHSARESGSATLRLYGWEGPWLSLGYAQPRSASLERGCRRAGAHWVRRSTGGGAVLHGADLTYCVAAPEWLLPGGLRPAYARIGEALCRALAALGVEVERAPRRARAGGRFDCFAQPAGDELCVGDRKLAGSAQRRVEGAFLQHGSLRLAPDPAGVRSALGLGAELTSLRELGFDGPREQVLEACVAAFEATLRTSLRPGVLSDAEVRRASRRGLEPEIRGENAPIPATPRSPGSLSRGPIGSR